MRKIFGWVFMLALTCAPLSIAWGQSAQQIGRYQIVVTASVSATFLVDTITGKVWVLAPSGECRGPQACFLEVDRLKLSESGWMSEIYPPTVKKSN